MRSFKLPPHLCEGQDPEDEDAAVTILMAIVAEHAAYLVLNFARLFKVHITSRASLWAQNDFLPTSAVSFISP